MVIKKDDPVIKAVALAWRCKSLVLCLALICSVMTQVTKYLSRFPTCEVKITFHLAWEFYLASHGQTASCSNIAGIEIWKVYEHCKVLINMKEVGFAFGVPWLVADIGFLASSLGNPICHWVNTGAQTRLSLLELMSGSLVTARARTKREEPWLALVQHHNRESGKHGVFWAPLPLGWILTSSVARCCSGDTGCTLNNLTW